MRGTAYAACGSTTVAERWDEAKLDGQLDAATQDCTISYRRGNKTLAVAVVHRDLQGLNAEAAFEKANGGKSSTVKRRINSRALSVRIPCASRYGPWCRS